jgi:hypothetical protein
VCTLLKTVTCSSLRRAHLSLSLAGTPTGELCRPHSTLFAVVFPACAPSARRGSSSCFCCRNLFAAGLLVFPSVNSVAAPIFCSVLVQSQPAVALCADCPSGIRSECQGSAFRAAESICTGRQAGTRARFLYPCLSAGCFSD